MMATKGGTWLLSLLGMIALPCLPLLIELLRTGSIKGESIYITASVISAGFVFLTEHVLLRVAYLCLFIFTLLFGAVSGPFSQELGSWAGVLLGAVAFLHGTERFYWHIVLDRPFPENWSA